MRVERHGEYRLIIGGPVPPQADAITLGKTIFVRKKAAASRALLAHELVHVRQYAEMGLTRFAAVYLGSYLRLRASGHGHLAAYRRIPLEIEACWVSRQSLFGNDRSGSVPDPIPARPRAAARRSHRRRGTGLRTRS